MKPLTLKICVAISAETLVGIALRRQFEGPEFQPRYCAFFIFVISPCNSLLWSTAANIREYENKSLNRLGRTWIFRADLINKGEVWCSRPDSLVSRASERWSESPGFKPDRLNIFLARDIKMLVRILFTYPCRMCPILLQRLGGFKVDIAR